MSFRVFSATLASIVCFLLGLFVYSRNPKQTMHRSFFAFNIGLSVWAIGDLLVTLAYTHNRHFLALWFDRLSYVGAIIVAPFFMLQLSALMDYANYGIHKIVKRTIYFSGVGLVLLAVTPWLIEDVTLNPFDEKFGPLIIPLVVYFVGGLSYGIYILWNSFRNSQGAKRSQIKYFAIAVLIGLLGAVVYFVSSVNPQFPPVYYYLEISYALVVAYAILAHRLMDISVIIRKTLIYSVVMSGFAIAYLTIITICANLFKGIAGYQTAFSSFVAASLLTIGFQPFRNRVQSFVDAKFFREYIDREEKLYELSRDVITHTTPEAMANALMRVLGDSFHPKRVALYLRQRDGSGFILSASNGVEKLPVACTDDDALVQYLSNHPQPFVRDSEESMAEPLSTRDLHHKGRPAA
jgi:hypothetical protein